jgi:hypothetical protein
MGNLPSIPGEPPAVKAAADQLKKDKDVKKPPIEPERSEYNMGVLSNTGRLGGRKLHRNVHRLKFANNKTKRVRRRKNRTLKVRR